MRILVVGPSSPLNTSLACHVLRTLKSSERSAVEWNVVTSYQNAIDSYQSCPNVASVTAFKDLKDDETDSGQGLVVEVLAASFFDKAWVKQRLRESSDLLVIASSPVTLMDRSVLESFDRVYLTKTTAADKQSQYFTLFADTGKQSFTDFKKTLKGLSTNQFARVTLTQGKPGRLEVETYTPLWESPTNEAKASAAPTAAPAKERPAPTVVPAPERPPGEKVASGSVELWLTMTVARDVALDDVVLNLRAMLGNELIASMLHKSLYHPLADEHRLNVYLQVFEQRQDLFASLALNMLQSLRGSGIITQGSLAV